MNEEKIKKWERERGQRAPREGKLVRVLNGYCYHCGRDHDYLGTVDVLMSNTFVSNDGYGNHHQFVWGSSPVQWKYVDIGSNRLAVNMLDKEY